MNEKERMEISMWWLAMAACPKMDAEPENGCRTQVLYAAAEEYWLGVRWENWVVHLNT